MNCVSWWLWRCCVQYRAMTGSPRHERVCCVAQVVRGQTGWISTLFTVLQSADHLQFHCNDIACMRTLAYLLRT
jgi:hypothetical protein